MVCLLKLFVLEKTSHCQLGATNGTFKFILLPDFEFLYRTIGAVNVVNVELKGTRHVRMLTSSSISEVITDSLVKLIS